MIFWMEAIVLCALFALFVIPSLLKDPLAWISDYPPEIQERAKELGLVSKEKKLITGPELARKIIGTLLIIVLFTVLMVYLNGAKTFVQGFGVSYALYSVITWFDAFVIDCIWFCHSSKVVIPGTEDLQKSYHDYLFHIKCSMLGMALGLPVCLLVGLGVMLLA